MGVNQLLLDGGCGQLPRYMKSKTQQKKCWLFLPQAT